MPSTWPRGRYGISMHVVDWIIALIPIVICAGIAFYARRFVRSVADFMAGGRHAGRFLVCSAKSEMGAGPVVLIWVYEAFNQGGYGVGWWGVLMVPIGLIVAISGFVLYRYRQTRALTLAQFFEIRYGRKFRLFTGVLAFLAGMLAFGINPVIAARFMVTMLDLPQSIAITSSFNVSTYLLLMGIFIAICATMTMLGGQITSLVTDGVSGMFSQVFYIVVALTLLLSFFSWSEASTVLLNRPPGHSMVNPFDTFAIQDFNIWFALMGMFIATYTTMAWQQSHAFNSSALSPHESRMGSILGNWRGFAQSVMLNLLALCTVIYLARPDVAAAVQATVSQVSGTTLQNQMRSPLALSQLLPIGVKGMFCSVILMGIFAGDGIQMHSWSSIFIQDVIMPLRKKPLSTRQHLALLRWGVVLVAVWAFCFGAPFPQTEYLAMWFGITAAVYTGGAGAAIIGGLYWSRGTAAGAWAGLFTGSGLSLGGIVMRQIRADFPFNGQQISFFACLAAIAAYITISLLTCKKPHNMDKLLHRGDYAVESDAIVGETVAARRVHWLYRIVGIDEEFTRGDRWITLGFFFWSLFWVAVFVVGTAAYLIHPWSDRVWLNYWLTTSIFLPLVIGVVTTVWFTWGCWHEIRAFFRRIANEAVDTSDDGSVPQDAARSKPADPHKNSTAIVAALEEPVRSA